MTYAQAIVIAAAIVAGAVIVTGRTGAETPTPAVTLEQLQATLLKHNERLYWLEEQLASTRLGEGIGATGFRSLLPVTERLYFLEEDLAAVKQRIEELSTPRSHLLEEQTGTQ